MDKDLSQFSGRAQSLLIPSIMGLPGVGPATYWKLQRAGITADVFWNTPEDTLLALLPSASHSSLRDIWERRERSVYWQQLEQSHQAVLEQGAIWVSPTDVEYPDLLSCIDQAPPLLYVQGDPAALSAPQVAFVGSRQASQSGLQNSQLFARYLASVGLTITSGLALGIDAAAHQGALDAQGSTVAVLGSGIDQIYPRSNLRLANQIQQQGGALVSEFLPGTPPINTNFPRRNRIVSGLSLGVLVVEAAIKSGSLITARKALEQGREVFAIPGSIHNPLSRGCHALIRDGAVLVETAEDIACELSHWLSAPNQRLSMPSAPDTIRAQLQGLERVLWEALGDEGANLDELSERLAIPVGELLSVLMGLELQDLIQQDAGVVRRSLGVVLDS